MAYDLFSMNISWRKQVTAYFLAGSGRGTQNFESGGPITLKDYIALGTMIVLFPSIDLPEGD